MLFPSNDMPQAIGKCRLTKLPQSYQDAFRDGTIGRKQGLFAQFRPTSQPHLWVMLIGGALFAFGLFPILWNRAGAENGSVDLATQPLNTQLMLYGLLALLSLSIYLTMTSAYKLWIHFAMRSGQANNRHGYGLLLDNKNLVARLPGPGLKSCYFIPRDHIKAMRFHRPSHRNGQLVLPSRLELVYVDGFGRDHTDTLHLGSYDDNELEAMAMRYTQRLKAG